MTRMAAIRSHLLGTPSYGAILFALAPLTAKQFAAAMSAAHKRLGLKAAKEAT